MLPEHKSAIIEYLEGNPYSSIRAIYESTKIDRRDLYTELCTLERRNEVTRHGGLDGTTITFLWKLPD